MDLILDQMTISILPQPVIDYNLDLQINVWIKYDCEYANVTKIRP